MILDRVRRGVVDHSPDLICAFDAGGIIQFINDAGLTILGWRRDDVIGHSFIEFLHPDEIDRAVALAMANLEHIQGPRAGAPYRLRCADGSFETLDVGVTVLDGLLVVAGRRMYDHELMDRVLDALTAGLNLAEVVGLLPGFDLWRNPTERCTLRCQDDNGDAIVVGSTLPDLLTGARIDEGSVWARAIAAHDHEDTELDLEAFAEPIRAAASEERLTGCRVRAVPDPRGLAPALITVWTTEAGSPIEAHSYPLAMIGRVLDLVLRYHQSTSALRYAAQHDQLTGLLNRAGFFAAVPPAGSDTPKTVLALDLNGFKPVNDRFGHAAGDEVLREIGRRLRRFAGEDAGGPGALVARLGGDEFVMVLVGSADQRTADRLASAIAEAVAQPIDIGGHSVTVTTSVGLALDAEGHREIDQLLIEADVHLYEAKTRSGGR
ncbi:MAG: sensor domain-containing diguanylate cyclase [Acidimicrobiales bacterium]|nr:sensor domain-containing diguanylate cyclase [Acidimicrobiales bacterium]